MRQRNRKKRIIAWMTCITMTMTSVPVNVLAGEEREILSETIANEEMQPGSMTLDELDGGKQENTVKTDAAGTAENTGNPDAAGTAENTGNPDTAGTAENTGNPDADGSVNISGSENRIPSENSGEQQGGEETGGDSSEDPSDVQVFWDASVQISWADEQNLADRRFGEEEIPFAVYADGVYMQDQPVIRKSDAQPQLQDGVETESYVVEHLARYREDQVTEIIYTVKEIEAPSGYREITPQAFPGGTERSVQEWLSRLAAPGEAVALTVNDTQNGYQAEKAIGNYLPAYQAEGTITWNGQGNAQGIRPELEAYFENQFTVLKNGEPYQAYRMTYRQDDEDGTVWHYDVKGLFVTDADGNQAKYQLKAGETEGYICQIPEITVQENLTSADFIYSEEHIGNTAPEENEENSFMAGQSPRMMPGAPEQEETKERAAGFDYGSYDRTAEAVSEYRDNRDAEGKRPAQGVRTASMTPWVALTIGGEITEYPLTDAGWENAGRYLQGKGYDVTGLLKPQSQDGSLTVTEENRGTNSYRYSISGLPGQILQAGTKIADLSYSLKEDCKTGFEDYINEFDEKDKIYYHHIKTEFAAYIDLRDGNAAYLSETYLETLLGELTLSGKGTDGIPLNLPLSSFQKSGSSYTYGDYVLQINKSPSPDGKNVSLIFTVTGLPLYTRGDEETIWTLKAADTRIGAEAMTGDAGDFYGILYDNGAVPNFGSVTDTCHNGGTITCTLEGTEVYTADKYWLDEYTGVMTDAALEQKAKRPELTFFLWRYAAQQGAGYAHAAQVKNEAGEYMVFKTADAGVQAEDSFEITFGKKESLPKYDPEGYRYVYLLREQMGVSELGTYEQVYGKVNETDGTVTDDKNPEGEEFSEGVRGSDQSIYDGGAISNRITGSVPVQWKKVWKASYHQNDLKDVAVTLTLMSRPRGSSEDFVPAVPVSEVVVDGFIAEQLTQSGSISAPAYDFLGRPLEYCFAESKITENGVEVPPDTNGNYRFQHNLDAIAASVQGENDSADDEYYISTSKLEGGLTTVTNELKGTTTYTVDKLWKKTDGEGYGKTAPQGATATVNLRQNNELYENGTAELNGENNYYYQYTELPKFDENGILYSYVVEECKSSNGWHPNYTYDVYDPDADTNPHRHYDAQIKNDPVGPGEIIKLKKIWLDDGDEQHRENVTVEVFRKARTGESADKKLGTYTLSAGHGWWGEFGIPAEDAGGEYYIREIRMGDADVKYSGTASNSSEQGLVEAQHHRYIVTNLGLIDGYYTVSNRRTGTVNMTVTKKWVDGDNEKNDRGAPELRLVWKNEDNGAAVDISDSGSAGQVSVKEGDSFPILNNDGRGVPSKQKINTDENESQYYFWNLPKYDDKGRVVHYEVEEITTQMGADYSVTTEQSGYNQGGAHFSGDDQQITVTNRKTGSRNVVFKKRWHDKYVNEVLNQRPDIYLELYQSSNGSAPALLGEYKDRNWVVEPGDDAYHWTCVFPGMDKYDDQGYEITYYGEEKSLVERTKLDYLVDADAVYRYELTGTDGAKQQEYPNNTTVSAADGTEVLKEHLRDGSSDGTFVNAIGADVHINGKKVWKSVPDGTPFADLPEITIHVDRTLKTSQTVKKSVYSNPLMGELIKPQIAGSLLDIADPNLKEDVVTPYTIQQKDGKDGIYSFSFDVEADTGGKLPKYNEDGQLYTYTVRETVPAGSALSDTAYEELPGEVNNYIITNTYETSDKKNSGKLIAKKNWTGITETDLNGKYQYPAVDFVLYRQYQSKDSAANVSDGYTEAEKIAQVRAGSKPGKEGASAAAEFHDLRIYAPNGTPYYYYVEERPVNGYSAAAATSSKITLDQANTGADSDIYGKYNEVSFSNAYTPEKNKVSLQMEKNWEDYGNALGTRPEFGIPDVLNAFKNLFEVKRYAEAQKGTDGAPGIAEEEITDKLQVVDAADAFYLSMQETGDQWMITIANLEQYAPNSMPWRYKITETVPDGYENSNNVSDTDEQASAPSNTIKQGSMTNSSLKSAAVTKQWSGMADDYGLRPTSVTVKLQAKLGDGGTWRDINESSVFGGSGADTVFGKICSANSGVDGLSTNEMKLTGSGDSWSGLTVKNLPACKRAEGVLKAYSYRFVETKIGDVKVSVTDDAADPVVYQKTGVYEPTQTVIAGGSFGTDRTSVNNRVEEVDKAALRVEKIWEDSGDAYDTRPGSIKVLLQRKDKNNSLAVWENVVSYGTTDPVYKTITVKGDTTSVTFGDLPEKSYDGNTEYEYRAVEADDTGAAGDVIGGYKVSSDDTEQNKSVITNTLNPTGTVRAKKFWQTGFETDKGTVYLELQYKITGKNDWKNFTTRQIAVLDGSADGKGSCYEEKAWEAVWTGVPVTGRSYRVVELDGMNGSPLDEQGSLTVNGKSYVVSYKYPNGSGLEAGVVLTKDAETEISLVNTEQTSHTVEKVWNQTDAVYKSDIPDSVTYRLYRTTDENGVGAEAGISGVEEVLGAQGSPMELTVSRSTDVSSWKENWSGTFTGLSKYAHKDSSGDSIGTANLYYYFAREIKINGKELTDPSNAAWNGSAKPAPNYEKDTAGRAGKSSWTNTMEVTSLTGSKKWTGDSAQYRPDPKNIKLTLYRRTAGGPEQEVTKEMTVSQTVPSPIWADTSGDTWSYTYSGLPKYDKNGAEYSYAVKETQADGYQMPAYQGDSGSAAESETITNAITEIRLDKVDESGNPINGVELEIKDGNTLAASWSRDASGKVSGGLTGKTPLTDGRILGLKGSTTYTVHEKKTPDGYLTPEDSAFTTDENGVIISADGNLEITDNGLSLKVKNTKIVGSVTLTKYLEGESEGQKEKLPGTQFQLYIQKGTDQDLSADVLYSDAVYTTDSSGSISVQDLPKGTYYFRETGATADSMLNTELTSLSFTVDGKNKNAEQPDPITVQAENKKFSASLSFKKGDMDNGKQPITSGVTFILEYIPSAPEGLAQKSSIKKEVDASGTVIFENLQKGEYTLCEEKPVGYEGGFSCSFTIGEEDKGENELKDLVNRTGGTITEGTMSENIVLNKRETGAVCIQKLSAADEEGNSISLDGAEFRLEKTDGTEIFWNGATFVSGKAYVLKDEGFEEITDPSPEQGIIRIQGLPWGTYSMKEIKAPAGYEVDADAQPVTFTVDREHLDLTAVSDGQKVTNVQNSVTLVKRDGDHPGSLLPGAVYSLTGKFRQSDGTAGSVEETKDNLVTGADGTLSLTGQLIGGETYTLTEIQAPKGYELPEDPVIEFAMNADGSVSVGGDKAEEEKVGLTDTGISLQLKKFGVSGQEKKELKGNALDGMTFTISGTFASADHTGTEQVTDRSVVYKYDADGKQELDLSAFDGRWLVSEESNKYIYTITEVTAPAGYELPAEPAASFTVDPKGNITLEQDCAAYEVDAASPDTLRVADIPVEVSLKKTDMRGQVINAAERGEAEFTVEPVEENTFFADGVTTKLEGTASELAEKLTAQLQADGAAFYKLTETKAPAGYVLEEPGLTLYFTVAADGTLTFTEQEKFKGNGTTEVEIRNEPICLSLVKTDIADAADTPVIGRGIAEFEVEPAQETGTFADGSKEVIRVSSQEGGMDALDGMLVPDAEYVLKETQAPAGYELAAPVVFSVNEQGKVTVKESGEKEADVNEKADGLIIRDRQIQIDLLKVSKETFGGENLSVWDSSCTFEVMPEEGSAFADGSDKITLNQENMADGLDGKLIAGHSYRVHEVTAPKGYELSEDFIFLVQADGTPGDLRKTDGSSADGYTALKTERSDSASETGRIQIVVADEPITVGFLKRFQGDLVTDGMEGAEFTLTGKLANGSEEISWISGALPYELKALLTAGESYTLTETKAPEGAVPVTADTQSMFRFTFTIDEHGNVTKEQGSIRWSGEDEILTVYNQPIALKIFKKGADNEGRPDDPLLTQCSFQITGRFAAARYSRERISSPAGVQTLTVTTNGSDTEDNELKGRLIVGETYKIKEVVPPNGYELGGQIAFTISGVKINGKGEARAIIEMAETEEGKGYIIAYDEDGYPIILQRDKPVIMKLKKTDMDGGALAGAEFAVTGIFGRDEKESTKTFTSDGAGLAELANILNESSDLSGMEYIYRIKETKAPEGYKMLDETLYIRLMSEEAKDGSRSAKMEILYGDSRTADGVKAYASLLEDNGVQTLQIKNEKLPVKEEQEHPKKPETTGEPQKPSAGTGQPDTQAVRNVKTSDQNRSGNWIALMAAAMSICLLLKRRQYKAKK